MMMDGTARRVLSSFVGPLTRVPPRYWLAGWTSLTLARHAARRTDCTMPAAGSWSTMRCPALLALARCCCWLHSYLRSSSSSRACMLGWIRVVEGSLTDWLAGWLLGLAYLMDSRARARFVRLCIARNEREDKIEVAQHYAAHKVLVQRRRRRANCSSGIGVQDNAVVAISSSQPRWYPTCTSTAPPSLDRVASISTQAHNRGHAFAQSALEYNRSRRNQSALPRATRWQSFAPGH